MRSKTRQRDSSSSVLSMLGTGLLLLASLAMAGLMVYLVLYPPGVLDPASQEQPLIPPGIETPLGSDPATGTTDPAATDPAVAPTQLTLGPACGAVSPLVAAADDIRDTQVNDPAALDTNVITGVTRDLQTLSNISPPELKPLIDSLNTVLVALNNSVVAGTDPVLDVTAATAATDGIRTLCGG